MKIYGCLQNKEPTPRILSEVTIMAEPGLLRELASFLYRCADDIEENNATWEHEIFQSSEHSGPQVVVFNPSHLDEEDDD